MLIFIVLIVQLSATVAIKVPTSWTDSTVQTSNVRLSVVAAPKKRHHQPDPNIVKPVYEPDGSFGLFTFPTGSHEEFVAYNRRNFEVKRARKPNGVFTPPRDKSRLFITPRQRSNLKNSVPYRGPSLLQRVASRKTDSELNPIYQLTKSYKGAKPTSTGEGLWAVPGILYRPHTTTKKPKTIRTTVAQQLQKDLEAIKANHRSKFDKTVRPIVENVPDESNDYQEEDHEDEEFVPTRTLAQVRKTEGETHLAPSEEDLRLRKVVKTSKIHTVYTEDGYEDSGYDHDNHEKSNEQDEDLKNVEYRNVNVTNPINDTIEESNEIPPLPPKKEFDSTASGTNYYQPRSKSKVEPNSSTEIKNIKLDGKEMQYITEIKFVTNPNNVTKAYKYVKIVPKRNDTEKNPNKLKRSVRSINEISNEKYPYYHLNSDVLNKNSPLRYAENLENAPNFYEQERMDECEEIVEDIDKLVDNLDKNDTKSLKSNETRIGGLGNKIDCLKNQYFGENPLDSPLFDEESIDEDGSLVKEVENIQSTTEGEENLPEPEALRVRTIRRKRRRKRPYRRPTRNKYRNKKKPTRLANRPHGNNSYILSEVHYKDEIKPNEQLNVFTDVINIIKSSTPNSPLNRYENSEDLTTTTKRYKNHKVNNEDNYVGEHNVEDTHHIPVTIPRPTIPRYRKPHRFSSTTIKSSPKLPFNDMGMIHFHKFIRKPIPLSDSIQIKSTTDRDIYEPSPKYGPSKNNYLPTPILKQSVNHKENQKNLPLYPPLNHNYEESTQATTINQFIVPGMKPPDINQNYRSNRIKRKNVYVRRIKRSPYKPSYSEIRRPNTRPQEEEQTEATTKTLEDEDDYVPQRNRNYHYDPESGKIIYLNKKQEEKEEEVEEDTEEVDIEEEEPESYLTLESTSPRPVWTTPSGPSFLHFVDKLKTANDYKLITDPTKPPSTTESQELKTTTSTIKVPIKLPEFLSIVSKVKNDDTYVPITKKPSTTTTASIQESYEEEDEEVPAYDITEIMPKPIDYPKTVIDYSKYKTIDRMPTVRHNLSSRYNLDEDELPTTIDTTQVPLLGKTESLEDRHDTESTTRSTTIRTTTIRLRRIRPKNRPNRTTTTTTTKKPMTVSNLFKRRRPTTLKPKTSTTTELVLKAEPSYTQRVIRRRLPIRSTQKPNQIPSNHKAVYVPVSLPGRKMPAPTPFTSRPVVKRTSLLKGANMRKSDVEVFNKYDKNKKHGGNYRRRQEKEESMKLVDIVPKPFAFYSDPKLPSFVNQLKEVEEVEEMKNSKDYPDYQDEVTINFDRKVQSVTDRVIVKDPSKRLYYYAPVK